MKKILLITFTLQWFVIFVPAISYTPSCTNVSLVQCDTIILPSAFELTKAEIETIIIDNKFLAEEVEKFRNQAKIYQQYFIDIKDLYKNVQAKLTESDKQKAFAENQRDRIAIAAVRTELLLQTEQAENELLNEKFATIKQAYKSTNDDLTYVVQVNNELLERTKKLRNAMFNATFEVTAQQKGRNGVLKNLGRKRITERLPLNENNTFRVKTKLITDVYVEASVGVLDEELPAYYIRLVYTDKNNKTSTLIGQEKSLHVPTTDGIIDHRLNFNYQNKGKYKLILEYEEDEEIIEKTFSFIIE